MTNKTCLRCDWEGEAKQARCPKCGVRLYVVAPPSGEEFRGTERGAASRERVATSDSPPPRSDPPPFPTEPLGSSRRFARSAGAFVLAALLLGFPFGTWLRSNEDRSSRESADAPVGDSSSNDHSSAEVDAIPPRAAGSELTVAGVPFSFGASTSGWERFDFSINKSIMGPQDAEAIVFWSSFPDGDYAIPCDNVLDPQPGPSAGDLAAAVASAPGTELVAGPSEVTVGGRVAKHVVLTVRERLGCDPGFFYTWPHDGCQGACWLETRLGDRIEVWIVDVAGTRIVIEAATARQADTDLEREIQRIVRSIRFDN
jgi:hypothetical protein